MVDKIAIVVAIIFVINGIAMAKTDVKEKKDKKIGKNINDYTESDIYKLADQWDVRRLNFGKAFALCCFTNNINHCS